MDVRTVKKYLSLANEGAEVYFDFCNCVPTTINSWRGIYAEPAIGWGPSGYSGSTKAPTVKEFAAELEKATSGEEYTGWKGGTFTYSDSATLHIDNPGDCSYTEIIGIDMNEYRVTIHTRNED